MKRLADFLALTPSERKVMLFLVVACTAGLGVRFARQAFASPPNFDYSASDSTYAAISAGIEDPMPEHAAPPTGAVPLNSAGKEALMTLPGVGERMAERIILDRMEKGPFKTVEDLGRVRGIGTKRIEQIKPLVTLD